MPTDRQMGCHSQAMTLKVGDIAGMCKCTKAGDGGVIPAIFPQSQQLARRADTEDDDYSDRTSYPETTTETIITTATVIEIATMTELATMTATGSPSPSQANLKMLEEYTFDTPALLWTGAPRPDAFPGLKDSSWREELTAVCNLLIYHENSCVESRNAST